MRNDTSKVFSVVPHVKRVLAVLLCSAVMLESASCTLFSAVSIANKSGRDHPGHERPDLGCSKIGSCGSRYFHDQRAYDSRNAHEKRVFDGQTSIKAAEQGDTDGKGKP